MKNIKRLLLAGELLACIALCACIRVPVATGGAAEHSVLHWEIVDEVGCESEGFRFGICVECKNEVRDTLSPLGHDFRGSTCVRCGAENPEKNEAGLEGYAEYELAEDGKGYILVSIGDFKGKKAVIPAEHEGLPVVEIGARVFAYNETVEEVVIPDSVKRVMDAAFLSCTNLEKADMGKSVVSLGSYAFRECTALRGISLPDSLESIGASCFWGCDRLEYVETKGCKDIGDYAFSGCEMLREFNFPKTLRNIGSWAFQEAGISSAHLPEGVKKIGSYAFRGSAVTEVTIPKSLVSENSGIFENCARLESAVVKTSNVLMEFEGCKNLKTLIIEEGVSLYLSYSIGDLAALETLYLPKSIQWLGPAFGNCDSAKKIIYAGTREDFMKINKTDELENFSDTAVIECRDGEFTVREYLMFKEE